MSALNIHLRSERISDVQETESGELDRYEAAFQRKGSSERAEMRLK